jgi:hypothetical protein
MTTRQARNRSIPTVIFLLRQCAEFGRGVEGARAKEQTSARRTRDCIMTLELAPGLL